MARKIVLPRMDVLAEKLVNIEAEMLAFSEPLAQLKLRKEQIRAELLEALKAHRADSFRTESGATFSRAYRASLTVTDPIQALDWAVREGCAKVDIVAVNKALKGAGALPEGFEQKETEYLRVEGLKELTS